MVVQNKGAYCPYGAVKKGDKGDNKQGGEGDTAEVGHLGVVVV